jgi:predicted PurR-regulated permease PerM
MRSSGEASADLARTTFQLLALGALIVATIWIVRPFLAPGIWAVTIVVATWPLLRSVERSLGGRRGPATAVMSLILLVVLVGPLYVGVATLVRNARHIGHWSQSLATLAIPQPPAWVATLPLIGPKLVGRWQHLATARPEELVAGLRPYARTFAVWFAGQVGGVGLLLLQFLLTVIIAAILYANGEAAAAGVRRFARRLAGAQGEEAVQLAGQAVRAVALGVVVTAVLQAALSGLGLAVAGVPFAGVLTAVCLFLAVAQIGAAPVLLPAVIWMYAQRGSVWGTAFLVWSIFCVTLDNFVRPFLIKRGADLPVLLIFAGVIGGLIAFGIIGLFIGPVVLAVAYTLLGEWVAAQE